MSFLSEVHLDRVIFHVPRPSFPWGGSLTHLPATQPLNFNLGPELPEARPRRRLPRLLEVGLEHLEAGRTISTPNPAAVLLGSISFVYNNGTCLRFSELLSTHQAYFQCHPPRLQLSTFEFMVSRPVTAGQELLWDPRLQFQVRPVIHQQDHLIELPTASDQPDFFRVDQELSQFQSHFIQSCRQCPELKFGVSLDGQSFFPANSISVTEPRGLIQARFAPSAPPYHCSLTFQPASPLPVHSLMTASFALNPKLGDLTFFQSPFRLWASLRTFYKKISLLKAVVQAQPEGWSFHLPAEDSAQLLWSELQDQESETWVCPLPTRDWKTSEAKPCVNYISTPRQYQFSIALPEASAKGLGPWLFWFSHGLDHGLRGLFVEHPSIQTSEILSSRRSPDRDYEQRLLRHQGCYILTWLEMVQFAVGEKLSSGVLLESRNEFFAYLEYRWHQLLVGGDRTQKLGDPLRDHLKNLIDFWLNRMQAPQRIILESGVTGQISPPRIDLQVVRLLLLRWIAAQGPSVLERQQSKNSLVLFQQADSGKNNTGNYEFPFLAEPWGLLKDLRHLGWDVQINNVETQNLSPQDVAGVLNVQSGGAGSDSWFELNPEIFFHGKKIEDTELEFLENGELLRYKEQLYWIPKSEIPPLKQLLMFWQKLAQEKTAAAGGALWAGASSKKTHKLARHAILDLLSLHQSGVKLAMDAETARIVSYFENLGKHELPGHLSPQIELKSYQMQGLMWMWDLFQLRMGGVLCDEMGLGKTAQALSLLELQYQQDNKSAPWLIVVPTSLVYNWVEEARKFFPGMTLTRFESRRHREVFAELENSPKVGCLIVTYGLLLENQDLFLNRPWGGVIFDEAHQLKNLASKRRWIAKELKASFKLAMTGTPIENNLLELYSLLDLVLPGALDTAGQFKSSYVDAQSLYRVDNLQFLKNKIKPLMLRRTKASVGLDLPAKIETVVPIDFEDHQLQIYKQIASSFNDQIKTIVEAPTQTSAQMHMLTGLLRLRQVCSHPAGLTHIDYPETPAKFEYLEDALEEIIESGQSILIFTQFKKTLEKLIPLAKRFAPVFTLSGEMPAALRMKEIENFSNTQGAAIMAMTLKTGGVGLNLTKANYVFHLEPWWNPAAEDQATDRTHRLGQTQAVNVYRLILRDSLEERIQNLKARKKSLFNAVLGSDTESAMVTAEQLKSDGPVLTRDQFSYLIGESDQQPEV